MASQIGLLVGAGFWGFSADVIGRKLAFNTSLFSCAALLIFAGGMQSYIHFFCVSRATLLYRCWGNYVIDATNFLEFLPTSHAWLVTFMGVWWAVGYMKTGFLAWGFMSTYSFHDQGYASNVFHFR
ncbi:hypothetical protein MHUMG1_04497 [Metarhizium humberi]|uniref:Major facilitator superfamily (MFS) profile domain-containing protein n=1 Tax=Metarhizium humberi TaxID=2596975 RepID=A0A9P8MCD2_9HYPO|nr:hypothetical protein MHUMG1_04497 [Metarhizium humberi]